MVQLTDMLLLVFLWHFASYAAYWHVQDAWVLESSPSSNLATIFSFAITARRSDQQRSSASDVSDLSQQQCLVAHPLVVCSVKASCMQHQDKW